MVREKMRGEFYGTPIRDQKSSTKETPKLKEILEDA